MLTIFRPILQPAVNCPAMFESKMGGDYLYSWQWALKNDLSVWAKAPFPWKDLAESPQDFTFNSIWKDLSMEGKSF